MCICWFINVRWFFPSCGICQKSAEFKTNQKLNNHWRKSLEEKKSVRYKDSTTVSGNPWTTTSCRLGRYCGKCLYVLAFCLCSSLNTGCGQCWTQHARWVWAGQASRHVSVLFPYVYFVKFSRRLCIFHSSSVTLLQTHVIQLPAAGNGTELISEIHGVKNKQDYCK